MARNQVAKYPKTYAMITDIIRQGDKRYNQWTIPEGPLPIYFFRADDGTEIVANNPEQRGPTPDRVYRSGVVGSAVKLFKIPGRSSRERWCFKYKGT